MNNMKIKNALSTFWYNFKFAKIALCCLFGISIFFVFSSNLSDLLGNYLKVHPSYTGGEIAGDFMDASGDDYGAGGDYTLCYPSNKAFENGSFDIIRYTVHQPVINARWQQSSEYWELDVEYKGGNAAVRNTMIYIDLDNLEEGSTETLFDSAEKITFPSEHKWDFAVMICGGEGKVFDSNGEWLCNAEMYILNNESQLKIRIPLQNKKIQKVLGAKKTYHFVLTGGYSQFDRGKIMPVEKRAALSRGGLENPKFYDSLIPNVYDVLGENDCLGTWDKETFEKAMLVPVEVSMQIVAKNQNKEEIEVLMEKITKAYSETITAGNSAFENNDDALAYYEKKLKENPEDYVSMAYYGSSLAIKGGESSVVKAVALVNEAYTYLDKAAELAFDKEGEIEVLMNRGSVSAAVPQQVFGKSESGAQDFMRIICLTDNQVLKAYCYVMAYKCYKNCDKETQALLALQEAEKLL